jgi:glycerol-3-phosphate dehydrogenase
MTHMRCDVVIVGAGVQGAGVAQAAAAAGYSVLLLERYQPAHGTSSRSSKLIHGGLRYLETAQFSLVRESLAEREIMLRNAPELVRLQPFYVPVYRHTRRRPWQLRAGLAMYTLLGGCARGTAFGTVPRRAWATLDGLQTDGLQSVFRYFDGQTDDAALTRAIVRSAQQLGATVMTGATFMHAELHEHGVAVDYQCGASTGSCEAGIMINAAGPWAEQVARRVFPPQFKRQVELVQGTHIGLAGSVAQGIYYVESPQDGRAVFVMPWQGRILVGTTETRYSGDPEDVQPQAAEIDYLLTVLKHYFPQYESRTRDDLIESFAGLRVLPAGSGRSFERSRETMLDVDRANRPRLLTIYGGKLTGWRATGQRVIERCVASLPGRTRCADTKQLRLLPD